MEDRDRISSSERDERREIRRQRRIRSQIIAYSVMGVFVIVFVAVIALGISKATGFIQEMNASYEASLEASKVEAEPAAVSSPDENVNEAEVSSTESMLDTIVETCLSEMPLEDKVAGLFMISPEQLTGADAVIKAGNATQDALSKYAVGGIYYSTKNIKDEAQLTDMLSSTVNMSKYPLFIATSEVGGSGSKVASGLSLEMPASPSQLAAEGSPEKAHEAAETVSNYLNRYGFNLNFGINANLSDSEQSFGTDQAVVSSMVAQTVAGLDTYGVSSCLQFFPEISDSGATAEGMADILAPFKAGIDAGADMIMVCAATSSGITGDDTPSCLSSAVVTDLLRGQLGYQGIIITDTLSDETILERYSDGDAAVAAIQAGADMIFIPGNFEESYNGVLSAVQSGIISEDRINESLSRIYRVKYASRVDEIASE